MKTTLTLPNSRARVKFKVRRAVLNFSITYHDSLLFYEERSRFRVPSCESQQIKLYAKKKRGVFFNTLYKANKLIFTTVRETFISSYFVRNL